jgi:hypothetical protein
MSLAASAAGRQQLAITQSIFGLRVDRLIAIGRAAFALLAALATWLDPSQPAKYPEAAYGILIAYTAWAVLIGLAMLQRKLTFLRLAVVAQLLDPIIFAALIYLTEGPTSPFFVLFTFAVLSALLKWQWRGALYMSITVIALYVGIGASFNFTSEIGELQKFIIRIGHLVIGGAIVVLFGIQQDRIINEMLNLTRWPEHVGTAGSVIDAALHYVSTVFFIRKILLVWTEAMSHGSMSRN